jgi:hypothetical protein
MAILLERLQSRSHNISCYHTYRQVDCSPITGCALLPPRRVVTNEQATPLPPNEDRMTLPFRSLTLIPMLCLIAACSGGGTSTSPSTTGVTGTTGTGGSTPTTPAANEVIAGNEGHHGQLHLSGDHPHRDVRRHNGRPGEHPEHHGPDGRPHLLDGRDVRVSVHAARRNDGDGDRQLNRRPPLEGCSIGFTRTADASDFARRR